MDVVITGGSSGLGRGMVEALLERGHRVTVLARDRAKLEDVQRLGAAIRKGDATDYDTMLALLTDTRPAALILNAGATPHMGSIDEQTWESFDRVWSTDVRAGLHGMKAALAAPMPEGSRVLVVSSGAAKVGAPLSGSYAGAKWALWLMARDANAVATERGSKVRFQVLVPMQLVPETPLARTVASEYARRRGASIEQHVAERYGASMSARAYGEHVASLLADGNATALAYGIRAGEVVALE
jgi:NAD(P)-dependent dehydrogenase (short-subunit alcohol dehydrogenase family)